MAVLTHKRLYPPGYPVISTKFRGTTMYLTASLIIKSQYRNRIRICYRNRIATAGGSEETEEEM